MPLKKLMFERLTGAFGCHIFAVRSKGWWTGKAGKASWSGALCAQLGSHAELLDNMIHNRENRSFPLTCFLSWRERAVWASVYFSTKPTFRICLTLARSRATTVSCWCFTIHSEKALRPRRDILLPTQIKSNFLRQ